MGKSVEEITREYWISKRRFTNGRQRYGGFESGELKRLKALEVEIAYLKRMYAELALDLEAARWVIEKKL